MRYDLFYINLILFNLSDLYDRLSFIMIMLFILLNIYLRYKILYT